jgi:hypothetical protein
MKLNAFIAEYKDNQYFKLMQYLICGPGAAL